MNTQISTLQERLINAFATNCMLNQAELAKSCGVTEGAVSLWFTGRTKSLSRKHVIPAAKYLNVSPAWLTDGPGSMPVRPTEAGDVNTQYAMVAYLLPSDLAGDAGIADVTVTSPLAFRRDWLKRQGLDESLLRVFKCSGDSMAPYFGDGDVVLLELSKDLPRNNQVWALRRDGDPEVRVKRVLHREPNGWLIRSDNPDKSQFPDVLIDANDRQAVTFIGRVLWRGG